MKEFGAVSAYTSSVITVSVVVLTSAPLPVNMMMTLKYPIPETRLRLYFEIPHILSIPLQFCIYPRATFSSQKAVLPEFLYLNHRYSLSIFPYINCPPTVVSAKDSAAIDNANNTLIAANKNCCIFSLNLLLIFPSL